MSSAVVIGASGGIGKALEEALRDEGTFDAVHGFSRSADGDRHLDLEDEASIAAAATKVGSPYPPAGVNGSCQLWRRESSTGTHENPSTPVGAPDCGLACASSLPR